jgi:hypothetical protein
MPQEDVVSNVPGQRGLLLIAGLLAILSVILIPGQIILWLVEPPPEAALEFIELLIERPVMGLFKPRSPDCRQLRHRALRLHCALRRAVPEAASILSGGAGAWVDRDGGILPNQHSVEMLHLSRLYETATAAERVGLLASADAQLAVMKGTGYTVFYLLSGVALLAFSIAMLKSDVFSRLSAWAGVIGGVAMLVPSNFGWFGLVMSVVSLIPWAVFGILVGVRLIHVSRRTGAVSH